MVQNLATSIRVRTFHHPPATLLKLDIDWVAHWLPLTHFISKPTSTPCSRHPSREDSKHSFTSHSTSYTWPQYRNGWRALLLPVSHSLPDQTHHFGLRSTNWVYLIDTSLSLAASAMSTSRRTSLRRAPRNGMSLCSQLSENGWQTILCLGWSCLTREARGTVGSNYFAFSLFCLQSTVLGIAEEARSMLQGVGSRLDFHVCKTQKF